jgi:D-sedoheptulose 7-phosphate isomerase
MGDDYEALAGARIEAGRAVLAALRDEAGRVAELGRLLAERIRAGGRILLCGNGGSAADALHLAAELSGRFLKERHPLPAIALVGNPAAVTAIGNDYGFESVFARQVEALASAGDAVIGLSTSGESENVIRALRAAGGIGALRVALTGAKGGRLAAEADFVLSVPSDETPRIQEAHILVGHVLCEIVETSIFPD